MCAAQTDRDDRQFSYTHCATFARVAQLAEASDLGSGCWRFESSRGQLRFWPVNFFGFTGQTRLCPDFLRASLEKRFHHSGQLATK